MIHLAMETRRQYMVLSPNDEQKALGNIAHGDATAALVRPPLKDVHTPTSNGNTSNRTKPSKTRKGKENERPKPVHGHKENRMAESSLQDTAVDKELDAIERDLDGIWEEDSMCKR